MSEVFADNEYNSPYKTQLDRIEAKLDLLLANKKPSIPRDTTSKYSDHFELAWSEYPKRIGNNTKAKASAAYERRRSEGVMADELNFAAIAYCRFCDATVEDKAYVMMASTFFGCNRPYEQDWTIPKTSESVPKRNDDLELWAIEKGFRSPRPGESFEQYRQAVNQLYRT